jgi:hypothetical protein
MRSGAGRSKVATFRIVAVVVLCVGTGTSCESFSAREPDGGGRGGTGGVVDAAMDVATAEDVGASTGTGGLTSAGGGSGSGGTIGTGGMPSASGGSGGGAAPTGSGGARSGGAGGGGTVSIASGGIGVGGGSSGGTGAGGARTGGAGRGGGATGGAGTGGANTGGANTGGANTGGAGTGGAGTGGAGTGGAGTGGANTGGAGTGGANTGGANTGGATPPPLAIEFVRGRPTANDGSWHQVNALCPSGKKVLGAGWAIQSAGGVLMDGVATYFYPGWDGSNWLVNGDPRTPGSGWQLEVSAACGTVPGYQVVTASTAADSTSPKSISVSCPAGTQSLAAGWGALDSTDAIGGADLVQFQLNAAGTTWQVKAANPPSWLAPMWKLTARTICVTTGSVPGYQVVTNTSPAATGSRQLRSTCPSPKRALFSGWAMTDGNQNPVDGQVMYSGYNGAEWLINASPVAAASALLQSRLVCVN